MGFAQLYLDPDKKENIINEFHKLYYNSHLQNKTWKDSYFLGTPIQKCPLDLFIYQEIIHDVRPDLIVEAGTASGGGALYLASICDLLKHGEVVTIDIVKLPNRPKHKRLKYISGSSTDEKVVKKVRKLAKNKKKVLVILDSDHSRDHVYNELHIYKDIVTPNSYMIVEDTNVNGHPVQHKHGPGPMEALEEFLDENKEFVVDTSREKHYLTFNPKGYLKKKT